jgi:hypothetical protein
MLLFESISYSNCNNYLIDIYLIKTTKNKNITYTKVIPFITIDIEMIDF